MLTPQEVSEHAFAKAGFGGYNMAMVDEFLDQLTEDYTTLYKENAALKNKMKVLVEKVEEYRSTEEAMRKTLLTAQKMADDMVKEAEATKAGLIHQAEEEARKRVLEEAGRLNYAATKSRRGRAPKHLLRAAVAEMLTPDQQLGDPFYLYLRGCVERACQDQKFSVQLLERRGVWVGAHISSIYGITDASLEDAGALEAVAAKPFPVLDDAKGEEMRQAILEAKNEQDSVGGAIECAVFGLPAGLGAPDFGRNVEGIFAQYLFAVPAVKGVDFGAGVAFSLMRGSEANDPFEVKNGEIVTKTNHAGGVNGGITNGMPVTFEVTIRPTPSIALPQESVDLRTGEETEIEIKGRHDPCIVPRAVPVIEAAAALAACEVLGI